MHRNVANPHDLPPSQKMTVADWSRAVATASTCLQRGVIAHQACKSVLCENLYSMVNQVAEDLIAQHGPDLLFQHITANPALVNVQAATEILCLANRIKSEGSQHTRLAPTIAMPDEIPASAQVNQRNLCSSVPATSSWLLDPPPGVVAPDNANSNVATAQPCSFAQRRGTQEISQATSSTSDLDPPRGGVAPDNANSNIATAQPCSFAQRRGTQEISQVTSSTSDALTEVHVVANPELWWVGTAWSKCPWYKRPLNEVDWACLLCGKIALSQHVDSADHRKKETKAVDTGIWERRDPPPSFVPHPECNR